MGGLSCDSEMAMKVSLTVETDKCKNVIVKLLHTVKVPARYAGLSFG